MSDCPDGDKLVLVEVALCLDHHFSLMPPGHVTKAVEGVLGKRFTRHELQRALEAEMLDFEP